VTRHALRRIVRRCGGVDPLLVAPRAHSGPDQQSQQKDGAADNDETPRRGLQHVGLRDVRNNGPAARRRHSVGFPTERNPLDAEASQLVLATSQDGRLRSFAQMMIDHHSGTTAALARAARAAGLTPPVPALDAEKRAMIQALRAAEGLDRDRLYRIQQVAAHRGALQLHGAYARSGDTTSLREAARAAIPIVARHLNSLGTQHVAPGHDTH
jgi:predicted outer membrane protein